MTENQRIHNKMLREASRVLGYGVIVYGASREDGTTYDDGGQDFSLKFVVDDGSFHGFGDAVRVFYWHTNDSVTSTIIRRRD